MEAAITALRQSLNNDRNTLTVAIRRIPEELPKNALGEA